MMGNTETVAGGSLPVQRIRCRLPRDVRILEKSLVEGSKTQPVTELLVTETEMDASGGGCEQRRRRTEAKLKWRVELQETCGPACKSS